MKWKMISVKIEPGSENKENSRGAPGLLARRVNREGRNELAIIGVVSASSVCCQAKGITGA